MKNRSITRRLFIQMIALILCFSGMILAGNLILIKPMVDKAIARDMKEAMVSLQELDFLAEPEVWIEQVQEIGRGQAFDITVESETGTLYSSSKELGIREPFERDNIPEGAWVKRNHGPIFPIERIREWEDRGDGIEFSILEEPKNNMDMVVSRSLLENGITLYLVQPIGPVMNAVQQANNLLIGGTLVFLLAAASAAFAISKTFTSPIKEMQEQVRRLSELDFSGQVKVNTGDELEALGKDIQELSDSLQTALQSLEKEIDSQKRLISDASHELRTPLTLIKGYADEIAAGYVPDAERQREYVAYIAEESAKMKRLINEILELSRLSSSHMNLNLETGNVKEAIEGFFDKYEGYVEEQEIDLSLDLIEAEGRFDPMRFEQILANFLSNAAKYGDEKRIVRVFMEDHKETIRIHVFNSGPSIHEDLKEKIWRGFYKADESRSNGDSFGLGLSIVKAIQDLQGLDAGVTNADGGVVFWFDVQKNE